MKICTKCKLTKELNEFGIRKASKDGLSYICKSCKKICDKENQIKNKDKIKNKQALYYKTNKDKIKINSTNYYYLNKENIDEKNRTSYYDNKEKRLNNAKIYYYNNKEKILTKIKENYDNNPDKFIDKSKNNYLNNKDKYLAYNKKYKENNKEYFKEYNKKYKENNKEYFKEYNKKYKKAYNSENRDKLNYKQKENRRKHKYRDAWRNLLKRYLIYIKKDKNASTKQLLGYSFIDLKLRMECQFKPGMTWQNHGKWHIDHKKPVSAFDKDTPARVVNMLSNLQPLWQKDNLEKKDKWQKKQY